MVEKNLRTPARTLSFDGLAGGLRVADRTFFSRLFLGTGKFSSHEVMKAAVRSSKTEVVTMALRRIDFNAPTDGFIEALKELEEESKVLFLPNTSGARDAEEAVRLAKMVRNATGNSWLKLEVTPDPKYLLPDPVETFKAAAELVKRGFTVLPYMNADPILAKRLEEVGCATVMPLGAPIGSNQGIKTIDQIKIIISRSSIPVVVDAGIGAPSHATLAMELGADAVLVNTAIATAEDPVLVAEAFGEATVAGRKGYLAKLSSVKNEASASSPLTGFLHQSSKKT